jgi:hypothetical protein
MKKLKSFLLIFFIPIIVVAIVGGVLYILNLYFGPLSTLIIMIVALWGIFSWGMADDG